MYHFAFKSFGVYVVGTVIIQPKNVYVLSRMKLLASTKSSERAAGRNCCISFESAVGRVELVELLNHTEIAILF